jgi:hypothetical protein
VNDEGRCRSGRGPINAESWCDTDLRSVPRVRSVPIATSTKAPSADAGPVRRGPTAAEEIWKGSHGERRGHGAPNAVQAHSLRTRASTEPAAIAITQSPMRLSPEPLRQSAQAHATRRRFRDATSVPSVSSVRENRQHDDADPVRPGLDVAPAIRISPRRARRTRRVRAHEEGSGRSDRRSRRTAHEVSGFGLGAPGCGHRHPGDSVFVLFASFVVNPAWMDPPVARIPHRGFGRAFSEGAAGTERLPSAAHPHRAEASGNGRGWGIVPEKRRRSV